MIELTISATNPKHQDVLERIESMTLAKRVTYAEVDQPTIKEGDQEYRGLEAMRKYLDEMEAVLAQWYECRCDKYED